MTPKPKNEKILRVAAVQMECRVGEVEWNLERSVELASKAAAKGVDLVCFPESVLDGYACGKKKLASWARPVPGGETARMAVLARNFEVNILWTLAETVDGGVANAAVLFDRRGKIVLHYRKVHLCAEAKEDKAYVAGKGFPTAVVEGVRVGVMICFDRHFPEAARSLRLGGAEVILHPTATNWFDPNPRSLNTAIMRTRAYENRCHILSVNQANYKGGSALFGPWGEVLAVAGREEAILVCRIDTDAPNRLPRNHFRLLEARRVDCYLPFNR